MTQAPDVMLRLQLGVCAATTVAGGPRSSPKRREDYWMEQRRVAADRQWWWSSSFFFFLLEATPLRPPPPLSADEGCAAEGQATARAGAQAASRVDWPGPNDCRPQTHNALGSGGSR